MEELVITSDHFESEANKLKNLQRLKYTYPPQEEQSFALYINLKA